MTDPANKPQNSGRRRLLQAAAAAPALAFVAPCRAKADAAMSKAEVGYQDVPKNGQVCAACVYFLFAPATSAGPASHCAMVAGLISPAGWCEVWAPKQ
jgi:hypothetical protein